MTMTFQDTVRTLDRYWAERAWCSSRTTLSASAWVGHEARFGGVDEE